MPQELAGRIPLDAVGRRHMRQGEVRELAEYLEVDVDRLRWPFRVIDAEWPPLWQGSDISWIS